RIAERERSTRLDRVLGAAFAEQPVACLIRAELEHRDAVLRLQVQRRLRHADAIDERRRSAGKAAQLSDSTRDQARVAQIPDAYGGIDAFLNEIQHAIVHAHLYGELRVLLDEPRQRGNDELAPERNR